MRDLAQYIGRWDPKHTGPNLTPHNRRDRRGWLRRTRDLLGDVFPAGLAKGAGEHEVTRRAVSVMTSYSVTRGFMSFTISSLLAQPSLAFSYTSSCCSTWHWLFRSRSSSLDMPSFGSSPREVSQTSQPTPIQSLFGVISSDSRPQ